MASTRFDMNKGDVRDDVTINSTADLAAPLRVTVNPATLTKAQTLKMLEMIAARLIASDWPAV